MRNRLIKTNFDEVVPSISNKELIFDRLENIDQLIDNVKLTLNSVKNSIMVSDKQLEYIDTFNLDILGNLSNSDWYDLMDKDNLLFKHHRNRKALFKDQMERAEKVVDIMTTRRIKTLRTLDGHGRFIFCFMKVLKRKGCNIDDYVIEIYDIDKNTHKWHEKIFPNNCLVCNDNICSNEKEDIDALTGDDSQTFLYLNFCSLGKEAKNTVNYIIDLISKGVKNLMVSFSDRATKPHGVVGKQICRLKKEVKCQKLCRRGFFVTYLVSAN